MKTSREKWINKYSECRHKCLTSMIECIDNYCLSKDSKEQEYYFKKATMFLRNYAYFTIKLNELKNGK